MFLNLFNWFHKKQIKTNDDDFDRRVIRAIIAGCGGNATSIYVNGIKVK